MATEHTVDQPYYVPDQSRFPILASTGMAMMVFGMARVLNHIKAGESTGSATLVSLAGFALLAFVLYSWFATQIRENHQGLPGAQLKRSYELGMYWFIFSEVMFFAAFFGALYYVRNFSVPWIGGEGAKGVTNMIHEGFQATWPLISNPDSSVFPNPHEAMEWPGMSGAAKFLPLWNTIILLTSSVTVHFAHVGLKNNQRGKLTALLGITVVLGIIFLFLQAEEYIEAYEHMGLTLNSGIYGSTFFLLTGFHGFHVTLGTFMLAVMFFRVLKGHFKPEDHFGFEAASWYWHFVDVVWVGLFIFVYLL